MPVAIASFAPVSKKVAPTARTQVVVIHGDPNKPDEFLPGGVWDDDEWDTLARTKEALKALSELRGGTMTFEYLCDHDTMFEDLKTRKRDGKVDLVLQFCDSGWMNNNRMEMHIVAMLEMLDLPYTGASAKSIAILYDKQNVTSIARGLGMPCPESVIIEDDTRLLSHGITYPVFVKPNSADGSWGITAKNVCHSDAELQAATADIRTTFGLTGPVLVQTFLDGRDINVAVLGDSLRVLPITEEDYSAIPSDWPKICGFESKWDPSSPYWNLSTRQTTLSPEDQRAVESWSRALFRRLDAHDYARFDWRCDSQGRPHFIEANPNCGWCWDGHLAKTAALCGIEYPQLLGTIIDSALERARLSSAAAASPKRKPIQVSSPALTALPSTLVV